MGFLDKAKKLAEQAQTKLDEVQTQINQQGSSRPGGQQPRFGYVEYDKHGRPIPPQQPPGGPVQYGPPLRRRPAQAARTPPPATPGVPPTEHAEWPRPRPPEGSVPPPQAPGVPSGPPQPPTEGEGRAPAMPGAPGGGRRTAEQAVRYAPPKLSFGGPLAG